MMIIVSGYLVFTSLMLIVFSRHCFNTIRSYEISGLIIDNREYACLYGLYIFTVITVLFTGYFIYSVTK